jgi:hypothetical protein
VRYGDSKLELTFSMEVTNQMLSLTGSLLKDPSNPPPVPETHTIPYRSPSVESEMEVDPVPTKRPKKTAQKAPRPSQANSHLPKENAPPAVTATYDEELRPNPAAAQTKEVIDERFLNPRELKKLRKDEEKRKRDARKARKEDQILGEVMEAAAEQMVNVDPVTAAAQNYDEEVGGQGGTGYGTGGGLAAGGKRKAGDEGKKAEKKKKRAEA